MRTAFALLVVLVPLAAGAHGGGLDRNGGHYNRKTGVYHCHREPCFSNQAKANAKPTDAKRPRKKQELPKEDGGGAAAL